MIAGHNYQIALINSKHIVNIEVASFGASKVTQFNAGDPAFFHANMYTQMANQPQQLPRTSSAHRIRRFKEIEAATPVAEPLDMLKVIGDQKDRQYPIYHDALSNERGIWEGTRWFQYLLICKRGKCQFMHRIRS